MKRALVFLALATACSHSDDTVRATLSVSELLSAPADPRFARALEPREFAFPADHGPHPEFQTEWWYFTGNLADDEGRELGFELTFFRRALAFDAPSGESAWNARDVYMAHLAVGDAATGEFRAAERFERAALGLAGAQVEPWRVWLRDWSASGDLDGGEVRLVAAHEGLAIDLTLRKSSAVVMHGDRGLSRKGREPGSASHYYSIPRLDTRGTITLDGRAREVRGASWFDREFFSGALESGQIGWDWFAVRFDDGGALMLYELRREDGSRDPAASGTFVAADGVVTALAASDFTIDTLAHWTSPTTRVRYPSRWRLRAPHVDLDVELTPLVPSSELDVSVRYWEGPVRATRSGRDAGRGFVELAGYE